MAATERVKRLRDRQVTIPSICVERAYYMTQSYRQTEALPSVLRRAMAMEHILHCMSIRIDDGELIVGWPTTKVRGGAMLVEINAGWVLNELEEVQNREWEKYQPLSEKEKKQIRELLPYWQGKTLSEKWEKRVTPEALALENIIQNGGYARNCHHMAHACPDYPHILKVGLGGIVAELEQYRDALDMTAPESMERYHWYSAAILCQKASIDFAHRHAQLAREKARQESDPVRRSELEAIAVRCEWVPEHPARDLQEAIQAIWLVFMTSMIECWGAGMSLGRLDQYLYPYYTRALADGMSREEIKEWISLLLIKLNGVVNLQEGFLSRAFSGYPVMQGITVGGITPEGADAVNELSYLILDAEEEVGLTAEDLVVRVNRKNPKRYVLRACEVARNLRGKLKFVGDESTIPAMLQLGVPIERARDYISTGCHNPMIPAFSHNVSAVVFNYALIVELTLTNGILRKTGQQIGPRTGDPRDFATFEQLADAFEKQFEAMADISFQYKNADMQLYGEEVPCPMLSSYYGLCRERGTDLYQVGTYPYATHATPLCGIANAADSLAAIKQLVYDERKLSMDELLRALENNYEGEERILSLIQRAPKFGNDDDRVDIIARDIVSRSCDYLLAHQTYRGRRSSAASVAMTSNISYGEVLGATPDGRRAGEPLAEGGISPHQGRNRSGMTATLNSVSKLDQVKLTNGSILNLRMSCDSVSQPEGLEKFASMLRTFFENGGNLAQFNFTSNEMLRDAQKHPERYRDLLVRVATYSSYFVELSPTLQENIISRTEFAE